METLSKQLKGKAFGAKGSISNNPIPNERDEEAAKKSQEESTHRIAAGAKKLLEEEAQKDKAEAAKKKNAEAILDKISELQKYIAQESANPNLGIHDIEDPIEGKNKENEVVVVGGGQEQIPIWDNQ